MPARRFVDTNVLLYCTSRNPVERSKTEAALEILESEDLALSVQVLQEFFAQVTRPSRRDRLTPEHAMMFVESWMRFPVQSMTPELFLDATRTAERYNVSYWDAAVIEAARRLDCAVVLSEDLNHGQRYHEVRVINPFRRQ